MKIEKCQQSVHTLDSHHKILRCPHKAHHIYTHLCHGGHTNRVPELVVEFRVDLQATGALPGDYLRLDGLAAREAVLAKGVGAGLLHRRDAHAHLFVSR